MLSIKRMGAGGSGGPGDYWLSLAREDYYLAGGEPPGRWHGQGAAALGLDGLVLGDALRNILQGKSTDGLKLVQGANSGHRLGWDFCLSAPKSVSVVWSQASDGLRQAIQDAQDRAVCSAVAYMETLDTVRRGKGGIERELPLGLVVAAFEHGTSRAQDPQIHTHMLVANLAPRADGTYGALETRGLYQAQKTIGALFRAELSFQLAKLGFGLEQDGESFRIAGIPDSVCAHFSQRREQIEQALAEQGTEGAKAAEAAALATREAKQLRPRAELFAEWSGRAQGLGFVLADVPRHQFREPEPMPRPVEMLQQLTEHSSTFQEHNILHKVAVAAQHRGLGAKDAQAHVLEVLAHPELVRLRNARGMLCYSSREMVEIERQVVEGAMVRRGEARHAVRPEAVRAARADRSLSAEQELALTHILGADGVACLRGIAGAGKSYLLGAAREAWERSGYSVLGCALAGKAAQGLQEGSGITSGTLHGLLRRLDNGKQHLDARTVIIVDEAGMVGSRQLHRLLSHAKVTGAKVVLVGDDRQIQSIEAGGSFRSLINRLGAAELGEIRRQRDPWARQAVRDAMDGRIREALEAFKDRNRLHIATSAQEAAQEVVRQWSRTYRPDKPEASLMLAGTRAEARKLNALAREHLTQAGHLGHEAYIFAGLKVRVGDRLLCNRNNKRLGVTNGSLGMVEQIEPTSGGPRLHIRLDDGKAVSFCPEEYAHVAHGYAVTTHKAQGVTVDNCYILAGGIMADRELSYVQLSRHRDEAHIFIAHDELPDLEREGLDDKPALEDIKETLDHMRRSRAKESTADMTESVAQDLGANHETHYDGGQPGELAMTHGKYGDLLHMSEMRRPTHEPELDIEMEQGG